MIIEQIYTGCLAQGAYYIESNGEAVVIDPLRETSPYIQKAKARGATIKFILETHFHADFVSGHVDLAAKTGATIVYGPNAETAFDAYIAKDGAMLCVGDLSIQVLHTPGHTMESTSYLLYDASGKAHALFSGDTLFLGDVGRPDLAVKTTLTREDLAGHLYDSLRTKIMTLADDVVVYPGHGAGSACGKNMSKETIGSIGHEKATNYALRADMTKAEFIKEVTRGLAIAPQYFPKNALLNQTGSAGIDTVYDRGLVALSPDVFEALANEQEALILDTRSPQVFKDSFVPNSINIGIDGGFAPWVGALILDLNQPILLITDAGREKEVLTRLARVGYDHVLGYLKGGLSAWVAAKKETDAIVSIDAAAFERLLSTTSVDILDVRKEHEFQSEHLLDATNFPLDMLNQNMDLLDRQKTYYIHCKGGYRSMIMSSILRARGFDQLIDLAGGFDALSKTRLARSAFVCPSTLG